MIKRIAALLLFIVIPVFEAYPACEATTKTYTACKAGYYLSGTTCLPCIGGGTSADRNSSGITACYIPAGTNISDASGAFKYTENCYYSR